MHLPQLFLALSLLAAAKPAFMRQQRQVAQNTDRSMTVVMSAVSGANNLRASIAIERSPCVRSQQRNELGPLVIVGQGELFLSTSANEIIHDMVWSIGSSLALPLA